LKRKALVGLLLFSVALVILGLFNPEYYHFPRCPFLSLTGFQCPGCGSQRAIHALLHGHILYAFRMNLIFIPGIIYAGTGFLLSAFNPNGWSVLQRKWYGQRAAYIALMIIIVFWIGRNLYSRF
jgi:hypothetical protein